MDAHAVFEILIREHADLLMAYIRTVVRDSALADDVFQETLLTAWRRLPDYDKSRPFGPWLRGIAGNVVLNTYREHRKVIPICDEELLEHLDARCELLAKRGHGDTTDEKLEALRDCVQTLPEPYRTVIEQRMQAEHGSPPVLAEQLGLNLETLKKRLQRARARLLECLQRKLATTEVPQ
jgi:RNA polymerase sigma-70 factor